MNKKYIYGLLIAVLALACFLVGYSIGKPGAQDTFGGAVHNIEETFDEGIAVDGTTLIDGDGNIDSRGDLIVNNVIGAGALSVSSGSFTLTAAQVCDSDSLLFTVTSNATLTFPDYDDIAADCLDTVGDGKWFEVQNIAASSKTCTFSEGSGMDLSVASGSADDSVILDQDESALIHFRRLNSATISANVIEF